MARKPVYRRPPEAIRPRGVTADLETAFFASTGAATGTKCGELWSSVIVHLGQLNSLALEPAIGYLLTMISPQQCRAARGWLGWTQERLSHRAVIGVSTVRDFEAGRRTPTPNSMQGIERAFAKAGVTFQFTRAGHPKGVSGA